MAPLRSDLAFLSQFQLNLFDSFYRPNSPEFVDAFAWFGQGVLFDPRRADVEAEVHTMNRTPPVAYHGWYVLQRAMMLLGISPLRWARISPVTGFAWALQSIAKPSTRTPNPGLPASTVYQLRASWLPKSIARLDQDFRSMPYPPGIS
ncbi:hypothetical protein [Actinocrispum sp. NPDC049592]|uniref:hypothetical protein n=1 Tax=Actinocrispum sp. NPDC049592 TaxID=3154835 RepID=UPI0034278ADD